MTTDGRSLLIVLRCGEPHRARARYVFDTLLMAAGIGVRYVDEAPSSGPWLLYAPSFTEPAAARDRCVALAYQPQAWQLFDSRADVDVASNIDDLPVVLPHSAAASAAAPDIRFDLAANAFYFLSSWSERVGRSKSDRRCLYSDSVFVRLGVPQDVVDRYLERLVQQLNRLCDRLGVDRWVELTWPGGASYALVLSHDVDFLPSGPLDIARQGVKTVLRHLLRQRDPADAWRVVRGFARACVERRDPYGCVPDILARERALGVRSSFQVAVGRRHRADVKYRIEDDSVRNYLKSITDAGFDLCLHGSVRSTENPAWYVEEAELLARRLGRPRGSRQHFLSFDYDALFAAQETAGIRYDMSMGYPDHVGARAGFSHPYFPYCVERDRPYDVLQISLFLMDVSLMRGYMGLQLEDARQTIDAALAALRRTRGCVSCVWHPIVFGGARDPGYDDLYWRMLARVRDSGGHATDGRSIDALVRSRALGYASFAQVAQAQTDGAVEAAAENPPRVAGRHDLSCEMAWPRS